jgi:hypothetical protein
MFHGRPVTLAVNDRFCLNVVSRFGGRVDLGRWATLNRCFAAGADKGVTYGLLNEYAAAHPCPRCPAPVRFTRAGSRAELIAGVSDWLRRGSKVVVKPAGDRASATGWSSSSTRTSRSTGSSARSTTRSG